MTNSRSQTVKCQDQNIQMDESNFKIEGSVTYHVGCRCRQTNCYNIVIICSGLHHGRRTSQTSVSQAPRVLVVTVAAHRVLGVRRRFDDNQVDLRAAGCRCRHAGTVTAFTSVELFNSNCRARLMSSSCRSRPHRDGEECTRRTTGDGKRVSVNAAAKCLTLSKHGRHQLYNATPSTAKYIVDTDVDDWRSTSSSSK